MQLLRLEVEQLKRMGAISSPSSAKSPALLRPHLNESFPNLLTEDPFYTKILPTLLPPDFKPQGILRTAIIAKPDHLHPFNAWSHVSDWRSQCSVTLAANHFGYYETLAPDMAIKMEERPIPGSERTEFWIHLRDQVYWAPLSPLMFQNQVTLAPHFFASHQVTAEDFLFYFQAIMNPWVQQAGAVALRNYLQDIEEVRVIDPLTLVVRWKTEKVEEPDGKKIEKVKYVAKSLTGSLRPLASFVYKYFADGTKILEDDAQSAAYLTNSTWAQNFNEHWAKNVIVSCGPWLFESFTDRQITFQRNPSFYEPLAALNQTMETYFMTSPEALFDTFKAGKIDTYVLRPDQLPEWENFKKTNQYKMQVARGESVNRLDFMNRSYTYIGWNEARPLFKSAKVRQALTMGIDRQRIIAQTLNGLGVEINGPFLYTSKAYDHSISPWPYDPQRARHLLQEEGWVDHRGTGTLDKKIDGSWVPFSFSLKYFVKSPTAQSLAEYVQLALKELQIACTLKGVDLADLSATFDDKNFDSLLMAWTSGSPPEEPRQLWHSAGAKEKGSSNAIGFAHSEADALIEQLDYTYNPEERQKLYHRFDKIIHDEAPYTFLYTPKEVFLYREKVHNVWIPSERPDLLPGATMTEPQPSIFWVP